MLRSPKPQCLLPCSRYIGGKPSLSWVGVQHQVGFIMFPTYGGEIIEYWTILSMKICLNQKLKNIGEFEHAIDILLLESP
jgi:hypothetical protein